MKKLGFIILLLLLIAVVKCGYDYENSQHRKDDDVLAFFNSVSSYEKSEVEHEDDSEKREIRIVAFGDVHGDIAALRSVMKKAGLIDDMDRWTGADTVVVQTGDLLDRGDDEIEIINLLEKLKIEAQKRGGEIYTLSGNHEIMNLKGDFRYVTEKGMSSFRDKLGISREEAFRPGGIYSKILSNYPVIKIFNRNVFVHGGLSKDHVSYGVDKINSEVRQWMLGKGAYPKNIENVWWMRDYSRNTDSDDCKRLEEVLNLLNADRMVVGHTVQEYANGFCGGRIIRIDTGMSKHYGGPAEAVEIVNGGVRFIR